MLLHKFERGIQAAGRHGADWTVYGSFTERPVNGPDECSTAHSQWVRQDNSLSTTMSRDKLAGCLGQESGAFYVWMTWAGQPVAMRSIPISVLDGQLAISLSVSRSRI